jgi:hypothetical protein
MGKTQTIRQPTDCQWYKKCNAPLCPYDQKTLEYGVFYPDEEICRLRDCPDWVITQKVVRRVKARNDMYFTYEMLKAIDTVRRGIRGISPGLPSQERKQAEQAWINRHTKSPVFEAYPRYSKANEIPKLINVTISSNSQ